MLRALVRGIPRRHAGDVVWAQERKHMMDANMSSRRDEKRREWDKICAEVKQAHQRLKKIDGQVTWLVAYVRGSLPPDPPKDQPYYPYAG